MKKLPAVSYKNHFPFDSPRDAQKKAIEFAIDAWTNKNKKYVILEMGTGCGKSAIGVTLSRWAQAVSSCTNNNDEYDIGSWYLTTQKVLQEQYMKDFGSSSPPMKTIKSASNYTCQMFDNSQLPMTCAEIHRLMSAHKFFKNMYKTCSNQCRYKEKRIDFIESLDSLTNYPFFFTSTNYGRGINPRELLILDEAHTIEEQLGKFVEVVVSERFAKAQLKKRMPKEIDGVNDAVKWVKKQYRPALKKKLEEVKILLQDPNSKVEGTVNSLTDYAKQFEVLEQHLAKINRFLKEFNEKNWVLNHEPAFGKKMRKLVFKPVDVSPFAENNLFRMGKKILFLSATILDKDVFCKSVGINPKDVAFHRVPSPFNIENRPIHVMPVGSMSKARIEDTLPKMAEAVKLLLEEHKDEKGIIHCVNYKVSQYLYENIASPRFVIHDSSNRDEMVQYHCEASEPTVLLSPSMMEGVDLRDDRSRFQVLCKVPFPYLGDKVIKKRMENNPDWYNQQTVRQIIQAFGRSIRNENDYAITYILDGDWQRFYQRTKRMFPHEILGAIQ